MSGLLPKRRSYRPLCPPGGRMRARGEALASPRALIQDFGVDAIPSDLERILRLCSADFDTKQAAVFCLSEFVDVVSGATRVRLPRTVLGADDCADDCAQGTVPPSGGTDAESDITAAAKRKEALSTAVYRLLTESSIVPLSAQMCPTCLAPPSTKEEDDHVDEADVIQWFHSSTMSLTQSTHSTGAIDDVVEDVDVAHVIQQLADKQLLHLHVDGLSEVLLSEVRDALSSAKDHTSVRRALHAIDAIDAILATSPLERTLEQLASLRRALPEDHLARLIRIYPMVSVPERGLKLTLWDFLLHLGHPGVHRRYVLEDNCTVVPNVVPAVVVVDANKGHVHGSTEGADTYHLCWSEPFSVGIVRPPFAIKAEATEPFDLVDVHVLANGVLFSPCRGQIVGADVHNMNISRPGADGRQKLFRPGALVLSAALRGIPPGAGDAHTYLTKLMEDHRGLSIEHLCVDHFCNMFHGVCTATAQRQIQNQIYDRTTSTDTRMTWLGATGIYWHLHQRNEVPDAAAGIEEFVSCLEFVQAWAAEETFSFHDLQCAAREVNERLQRNENDRVVDLDVVDDTQLPGVTRLVQLKGVSICLEYSIFRLACGGAYTYAMAEHFGSTGRDRYQRIKSGGLGARRVHHVLVDTLHYHRFESGKGRPSGGEREGHHQPSSRLSSDQVYFARRTGTGTLEVYRRTVAVVDGTAHPLHVDHVASHVNDRPGGSEADEGDVVRYTRLFSSRGETPLLEWVTLRENMARSNGYKLDFDVVLRGVDETKSTKQSIQGATMTRFSEWFANLMTSDGVEVAKYQVFNWLRGCYRNLVQDLITSDRSRLHDVLINGRSVRVHGLDLASLRDAAPFSQKSRSGSALYAVVCFDSDPDKAQARLVSGRKAALGVLQEITDVAWAGDDGRGLGFQLGSTHSLCAEHKCVFTAVSKTPDQHWTWVHGKGESMKGGGHVPVDDLLRSMFCYRLWGGHGEGPSDGGPCSRCLEAIRVHYEQRAQSKGFSRFCRKNREKVDAACDGTERSFKENGGAQHTEDMRRYCRRLLGKEDRETERHIATCHACFVYALVALWDKSGQGSLDAGDTPIFPGLTHCRRNGKLIPDIGDVFVRLFQQLGQQKENVDDQDQSNFRGLLNNGASTKEDFRRAVRSVLEPSTALPLPASPSSSPAHKKPKGSVDDVVVDLTGDDAPSGAQTVVASVPNMAHVRLSNTCPAVPQSSSPSVPPSVPSSGGRHQTIVDLTGSDDREASRSDRGSSRPVSRASAVQTKTTKITKFFKRVQ